MKKIIVIGGGPAGMMAAIRAAQLGAEVVLLEKNDRLGKKLLLTGKGRCNLTNTASLEEFLKRFDHNGPFLRDAFKIFFNRELMAFFEEHGVALKVERQQRVFPESDRAQSILRVLEEALRDLKVDVRRNTAVERLILSGESVIGIKTRDGQTIGSDAVVLASGGVSYQRTGSTGDGLRFAKACGHTVVPLRPGLVALETPGNLAHRLEGLTLKNVVLIFSSGRKKIRTEVGELIFTAHGVSGPLVLSHSGTVADWLAMGRAVNMTIDLKPALSEAQLDDRLVREFQAAPKTKMKNTLKNLLPQRLIAVCLDLSGIDPDKTGNQISHKQRYSLVRFLKCFSFDIVRPGPLEQAMVTRGGISVKDVDPRTMRSRLIRNLFFAGEILDLDGDTGGFNLQAAFSTGYLAGQSCLKETG